MTRRSLFAKRVFFWAGIYGILVLSPPYFLEERLACDFPPPCSHPEQFYGFLGRALAWQVAFLLFAAGRVAAMTAAPAVVDLFLALLFMAAFWRSRGADSAETAPVVPASSTT